MEFKDIVNERLEGMYSLIESSNSVILEEYKKKSNMEVKKGLQSFFNFLKKEHPKKAEECEKNPKNLVKMITNKSREFEEWLDKHPVFTTVFATVTAGALLGLAGAALGAAAGISNAYDKKHKASRNQQLFNQMDQQHRDMMIQQQISHDVHMNHLHQMGMM